MGVDIGTASIKVCLLKKTKAGDFTLSKTASKSYDKDLLHDGNIIDSTFVAQELKSLLIENSITTRFAALIKGTEKSLNRVLSLI